MTARPLQRRLQVGGTLDPRRHVYIERPTDAELLRRLLRGEYCSVLTSRQMGKSSLMARTAFSLAEAGVRYAQIDFSGDLGTPREPDEWYLGIVAQIAEDLRLGLDAAAWWREAPQGTRNQKLLRFFREAAAAAPERPIVLFFDEIDATLKFPYTDDLYTALRTLHNQRPFGEAYQRITCCLLGVVTPNELIKQRRTTPYNVGHTLELRDFVAGEDDLSPLSRALSPDDAAGAALLRRVLHWTGGHPFLTVKVCEDLQRLGVSRPEQVDDQVSRAYSKLERLANDVHFDTILRHWQERVAERPKALRLYERICQGDRERDETDLAHAQLKLSGLVKRGPEGFLVVRNRIYEQLFTAAWAASLRKAPALDWRRMAAAVTPLIFAVCLAALFVPDLGPRRLQRGNSMVRELRPGETHVYLIETAGAQVIDLEVRQQGVDVALTWRDPAGRTLRVVDSPTGPSGTERLFVLTDRGGTYRLDLRTPASGVLPGQYRLVLKELRRATVVDRQRAVALAALAEARASNAQGKGAEYAVHRLEEALRTFQSLGDSAGQAEAIEALAAAYRRSGRHRDALEVSRRALRLTGQEAKTRYRIGRILLDMGDPVQAIEELRRAERLSGGDEALRAQAAQAIAEAQARSGQIAAALSSYAGALEIWRLVGDPNGEASVLLARGQLFLSLDEAVLAGADLQPALEVFSSRGDRRQEASTLAALGVARERTGDFVEAGHFLVRSAAILSELGDRRASANVALHLGWTLTRLGRTTDAMALYEGSLLTFQQLGEPSAEAGALVRIAELRLELGQPVRAVDSYRRALEIAVRLDDREGTPAILAGLAEAERRRGDLAAALRHAEQALSRGGRRSEADLYELRIRVLMDLDQREPARGYAVRAFETAEALRARSLQRTLAEIDVERRARLDPELSQVVERLEAEIRARAAERLLTSVGGTVPSPELGTELRRLLVTRESLLAEAAGSRGSYLATLGLRLPMSLRDLQRSVLDPDTVLLEYQLDDDRSYLWVVTSTAITSYLLPPRSLIESAATSARRMLERRLVRESEVALSRLADLLLRPAAGQLQGKRLLIVPDGELAALPFAALPAPALLRGDGEPLISRFEIVTMPSATMMAVLRSLAAKQPSPPGALAVVANPVIDPPFAPLPFTAREANEILRLVPSGDTFRANLRGANRQLVFSGVLSRFQRVHFATHALVDERYPELSGLLLSRSDGEGGPQDGFLSALDVRSLSLPAELVVLSGCRTALGSDDRSGRLLDSGPASLAQAFMLAGAQRVVASLWAVDDRSTTELMISFYQAMLRDGRRPAEALRLAQLELRNRSPWQTPYFWAGFTFQGEWR